MQIPLKNGDEVVVAAENTGRNILIFTKYGKIFAIAQSNVNTDEIIIIKEL